MCVSFTSPCDFIHTLTYTFTYTFTHTTPPAEHRRVNMPHVQGDLIPSPSRQPTPYLRRTARSL